jgi:HEXXH motif-containing protein
MGVESTAEQLYYSPEAIGRFANLEEVTRRRQLGHLRAVQLPGVAAAEEFIQANGDPVIMGPLFGAWLDRTIQAQYLAQNEENDGETLRRVFYIGNYAAAAALATGQEKETMALLHHGHIMIPEVGRIAVAGRNDSFARIHIGDDITVVTDEKTIHIARADLAEPTPNWEPLRYIGPPDFRVALNDIDPNREIFRYPAADRLDDAEYNRWHAAFTGAWDFIQGHDPAAAAIVRASLTTIVPAPTEPLTHGKSMAAGAAFGVIGINEHRDPQRLASHIIYGTRKHIAIALRGELPGMYLPENHPLATKPVYPPSREGHGIAPHLLDDSFIDTGLAKFFAEVAATAHPSLQEYAQLSFARWFVGSEQNLRSLRASGYITPGNAGVAAALEREVAAMASRYEHVPEHIKQAITTSVLDRAGSWRLHNITPDTGAVQYLRDTWLRGEQCPPLSVRGELSSSIEAYTHIGQRTRYVLKESSIKDPQLFAALLQGEHDPQRFGEPTPGDIAFASGNVRAAREYFAAAIQSRPSDPEAWAGFALTFEHDSSAAARVLLHVPELAAALYTAIGDSTISPEAVAAWATQGRVTTKIDTQ